MTDTTVTTEAPTLAATEAPAANTPEARTPDGTIKDQTPSQTTTLTEPPKPTDTPKAPETYADFKAPEGITLNPDLLKEATGVFKELGLTQDQAQKLVDLVGKDQQAKAELPQKAFNDMVTGWRNDTLKDTSLTRDGALLPDVAKNITALKSTLGDQTKIDQFNNLMNLTGLGNHPLMVSALATWGKQFAEGSHVSGKGPSPHGQTAPGTTDRPNIAKAMWPNNP